MKHLVSVNIQGLGERARQRLQSFLFEIADDLCDVTASVDLADAVMADTDGGFDLESFRNQHPHKPIMVLASSRPDYRNVIWIPKPIMEAALTEALSWVRIALEQGSLADPATVRKENAARLAAQTDIFPQDDPDREVAFEYYPADETFLHLVLRAWDQAKSSARTVRCRIGPADYLLLLPGTEEVHSSVANNRLLTWCEDNSITAQAEIDGLSDRQARPILASLSSKPGALQPLVPFLWRVAVWTSRGRLPSGLDPSQRYYLRAWPNFTRLLELPHALAMAALWVREPMSMSFVARALRLAAPDVANFYAAASAIGLAGPAVREADYLLANKLEEGRNSRIIHVMRSVGRHFVSPAREG